jgi:hypothetical protein
MTDTPTTAPPLLSRDEIESWPFGGSGTDMMMLATALAAYDPSGKLWSERAREAADELFDLRIRFGCGPDQDGPDVFMQLGAAEAQIAALTRALADAQDALRECRTMVGHPDNIAFIDAAIERAALPPPDLSSCPRCETMEKQLAACEQNCRDFNAAGLEALRRAEKAERFETGDQRLIAALNDEADALKARCETMRKALTNISRTECPIGCHNLARVALQEQQ